MFGEKHRKPRRGKGKFDKFVEFVVPFLDFVKFLFRKRLQKANKR